MHNRDKIKDAFMNYFCSVCKKNITYGVYKYSMDIYSQALCEIHQKATKEELKLYAELKKYNIPMKLQFFDGYKTADILIEKIKLIIEVDGIQHAANCDQALADLKRAYADFKKGFLTIHIPNCLVKNKLKETAKCIADFFNEKVYQSK